MRVRTGPRVCRALRRLLVCVPPTKQRRKPSFTSPTTLQEPAVHSGASPTDTAGPPRPPIPRSPLPRPTRFNDSTDFPAHGEKIAKDTEAFHAEIRELKEKIGQLESRESVLQVQLRQKEDALKMLAHERWRTPVLTSRPNNPTQRWGGQRHSMRVRIFATRRL